jgi:pyruvate-formate lyase-activating enzyme
MGKVCLDRYAPSTPLGHMKDALLRARSAAAARVDRLAALYLEPRGRQAVIRALNFELCSACNLRCKWCSLDSKLRGGVMKIETFRKVLEEIRDESRFRVKVLNLHHSGDVLLHPKFGEFLQVVSEEKRRRAGRFPSVQVLTSATHLKGDKAEALLESDAVDWLRFSVDGGNPRDFEAIRIGAKWDQVVGNIHAFLDEAERRGKRIRTGVIATFETSEPEIHEEFRRLVGRVTNYMPRLPHNWVGKKDLGLPPPPEHPQGLCKFVLSQAVVLYDGKVTLCCNDLNGEGVTGGLATASLYDIFRGEKRAHHIRLMKEGRRRDLPFCGTCDQL